MNKYNLVWSANSFMREQIRNTVLDVSQNREARIVLYDNTEALLTELLSSYCEQFEKMLSWLKFINDAGARFWEADCPTEILYTPSQKNYVKNLFVANAGKSYEQVIEDFAVMGWHLSQLPRPTPALIWSPGSGASPKVISDMHFGFDFTPIMHGTLRFLMGLIQDLRVIYDEGGAPISEKITFGDFFIDWFEVHFRFYLREYRKRNPPPPLPSPTDGGGTDDEGLVGFGPMTP